MDTVSITTVGVILGAATFIITHTIYVNNTIKKHVEETGAKRERIYARLDDVKKQTDEKFVKREVCHIHMNNIFEGQKRIEDELKEMKFDIKEIKKNGKHE